jgi:acyl transferase domain-containing protein
VDTFDADFFGIPRKEAARVDPQHRLLLECSWEALERAGYAPGGARFTAAKADNTGTYIGIWSHDYRDLMLLGDESVDRYLSSGTSPAMAAGRIAYHFDLGGPTFSVDTACSSSLVAIHLACEALRSGECGMALAGGVNLILTPHVSVCFTAAQMLSKTNRCRSFDDAADGYVRGEGCGVLVLKRLSDAHADGDLVLAVLAGSAINSDGRTSSLTAPSVQRQREVIRHALAAAKLRPEQVSYVEAHGTGTPLGDPIEMEAIQASFPRVAVGSIKTNIGHLESAAGVAGVLKVMAMLQYRAIPPHPSFESLNRRMTTNGVDVITELTPWSASPRIAGVSSFGFSGTNAHVVIMEPPLAGSEETHKPTAPHGVVVVLSAKSNWSLRAMARGAPWLARSHK